MKSWQKVIQSFRTEKTKLEKSPNFVTVQARESTNQIYSVLTNNKKVIRKKDWKSAKNKNDKSNNNNNYRTKNKSKQVFTAWSCQLPNL